MPLHDISNTPLSQVMYLGYNTAGGSFDAPGVGTYKQIAKQVTPANSGLLTSVEAWVKGDGNHIEALWGGLYDDNAGAPGNLIGGISAETAGAAAVAGLNLGTTARWITLPIGRWLTANTAVWLAILTGNGMSIAYDSSGSDQTASTSTALQEGGWSNSSRKYSIRGTFIE